MAEIPEKKSNVLKCPSLSSLSIETGDAPQQTSASGRQFGINCAYYPEGKCRYGDRCYYRHDQPSSEAKLRPPTKCVHHALKFSQLRSTKQDVLSTSESATHKNSGVSVRGPGSPNWADAPEFVPRKLKSFADALKENTVEAGISEKPQLQFCGYFILNRECPLSEPCPFVHGDKCDVCELSCLDPSDESQRKAHMELCEKYMEEDMQFSFAVQLSQNKLCGICKETVYKKEIKSEQRFGILDKCNHIFCLSCIRTWRSTRPSEDNDLNTLPTRRCPECRTASDFVIPSKYWVEGEDKVKLISDYKMALGKKHCKHFKQGDGKCPFGGECFYLHARPDGTLVKLPPPLRRRRIDGNNELDIMEEIYLFDFLVSRDEESATPGHNTTMGNDM